MSPRLYLQLLRIRFHVKILKVAPIDCVLVFIDVIQARDGQVGVVEACGEHVGSCTSEQIFRLLHRLRIELVRIPFHCRLRHGAVPLSDAEVVELLGIFRRAMLDGCCDGLVGEGLEFGGLFDGR